MICDSRISCAGLRQKIFAARQLKAAQFFFVEERAIFFVAEVDKVFALVGMKFQVRKNFLRVEPRVLLVSFFVDKNIPALLATVRVAFGAVAFKFAHVLRLKIKIFFLHEFTVF